MDDVKVAVVDVGSNTVRLLVGDVRGTSIETLHEERVFLGLGAEILEHGRIRPRKLREVTQVAEGYASTARRHGARALETVVTAPGRQGESSEALTAALVRATAAPVRVVSADEEGRLAFAGAISRAGAVEGVVAVCDVGGGSTEVVVGTPVLGAAWVRSVDIGSLRLTAALLHDDPPSADQVAAAREAVTTALAPLVPPRPALALATGGSARAIAKAVGGAYGPDELEQIVRILSRHPAAATAKTFRVEHDRARSLLAGALILKGVSELLDAPFVPARGGIREGAALALAAQRAAA